MTSFGLPGISSLLPGPIMPVPLAALAVPHQLTATALALLLSAAVMHASWNLLVKRSRDKMIFTGMALIFSALMFLLALPLWPYLPGGLVSSATASDLFSVPGRAWIFATFSGMAEAAYIIALTGAYHFGDFSEVYPLARGSAPAITACWAMLFLGERFSPGGYAGIGLIIVGIFIATRGGEQPTAHRTKRRLATPARALALLSGLCISLYTTIDTAAVRSHIVAPTTYITLIFLIMAILLSPLVIAQSVRRSGRKALLLLHDELCANWLALLIVGILNPLTYLLVLYAVTISPVGYASAIRESSIILGSIAGWLILRERFGLTRTIAAIVVFTGILLIALRG